MDEVAADVRERARDRGRAMLAVLRGDPAIVNALLPEVMRQLRDPKKLTRQTLQFCAALAARARQLDKAEEMFRQCLVRAPLEREAALYGGLLEVLWMQHKHDAVIALCKEALGDKAQATNLELFHRNLALALSEKDKHDEAVAEIDKAIKLAAETARVIERCARARILARAERYDAAVGECDALLKELTQANEIKRVRFTLAAIFTLKGDHDKSNAHLEKVLEDDPNDAEANNDLGYQLADRNRNLDEAEKMIRKAVEVDRLQRREDPEAEDNAAYLDSLGWVLFRRGKLDEARDWLEKAVALPQGADDPTVWDHLGDVYFKLDLPGKAKDAWQNAIKLYDHDKRSQKEGRQDEARRKLKMVAE
jgi:tetratricopeptide (TPR) repeat protein